MTDIVKHFGIYPETINDAYLIAESAMQDAGCTNDEIDGLTQCVDDKFRSGELDYNDITNSIMYEMYAYAKDSIEQRHENIEITFYINGDDTHFYVNGEQFYKGDSLVSYLAAEEINISYLEEASYGSKKAVKASLNILDDDILFDIVASADNDDISNEENIQDGYFIDIINEHLHEELSEDELIEKIDNADINAFDVDALLVSDGKTVIMLTLSDSSLKYPIHAYITDFSNSSNMNDPKRFLEQFEKALSNCDENLINTPELEELMDKYMKNKNKDKEKSYE